MTNQIPNRVGLNHLYDLLGVKRGAQFCTVIMRVYPDMVLRHPTEKIQDGVYASISGSHKKGDPKFVGRPNPFVQKVVKISHVRGMVNYDYAAAVNRQLVREGKEPIFVPESRLWGKHVQGTPFITHQKIDKKTGEKIGPEKAYIDVRCDLHVKSEYQWLDGRPLTADQVTELKAFITKEDVEAIAEHQGVDEEAIIRPRTIWVGNIVYMAVSGKRYHFAPVTNGEIVEIGTDAQINVTDADASECEPLPIRKRTLLELHAGGAGNLGVSNQSPTKTTKPEKQSQ